MSSLKYGVGHCIQTFTTRRGLTVNSLSQQILRKAHILVHVIWTWGNVDHNQPVSVAKSCAPSQCLPRLYYWYFSCYFSGLHWRGIPLEWIFILCLFLLSFQFCTVFHYTLWHFSVDFFPSSCVWCQWLLKVGPMSIYFNPKRQTKLVNSDKFWYSQNSFIIKKFYCIFCWLWTQNCQ